MAKKIFLLLLICLGFSVAPHALAAELLFGVANKSVSNGSKFEVGVFVDSQKESVNAIEGTITFPADALEFSGLYTGNSILPFWIQSPALSATGVVSFAGMVPGGFNGAKGYLFSILFTAKKEGSVTIAATQEKMLLNDGQGSAATIAKAPLVISVNNATGQQAFNPLYDSTPPEPFLPSIARDANVFDGKWFLNFVAQDKGSGIDHYEIMEQPPLVSFQRLFFTYGWVTAESPYVLPDQSLTDTIFVKAVDRAGNQQSASLPPKRVLPIYENYVFWLAIIIISLMFIIWKYLIKRK